MTNYKRSRNIFAWAIGPIFLGALSFCSPQKAAVTQGSVKSGVIRIGVQPNESAKDLSELQTKLSSLMGKPVEFYKPTDYSQLVNEFKSEKIDFAFMTGLIFIEAEKEAFAKALLKKVYGKNEFYFTAILVNNSAPFKSVKSLAGKKFGFVDVKSTSGYLYPRVILRKNGLDAGEGLPDSATVLKHEFFGTHEKSVRALAEGKVDAVGVWADDPSFKTGAWTDAVFAKEKKMKFRVLEYSDPIPNDVFVVREKFYSENPMTVLKLMEAFIGLSEEPHNVLKKVFDIDRLTTATSRHYDSVRALQDLMKGSVK